MVVGLGNPGTKYAGTRHNLGFRVIDSLAASLSVKVGRRKFGARLGEAEFGANKVILLKPWLFMNLSGQAVVAAVRFYRLPLSDLIVVTDDLALEPGRIRLRAKGSAGGHNGLADIIEKLGTNQFARCRLGIGHSNGTEAYDYVLDKPAQADKSLLDEAIEKAREAVLCWIRFGIERAMNQFNNS